jgi:hypothetical protein
MQPNGIPVNFGYTGTNGIVITEMSGKLLLQSSDLAKIADLETVRGGQGDHVFHGWYDIHDEASIEAVITDVASTAAAIVNTTLAAAKPGDFINITTCQSHPGLVGKWEVQSNAKITKTNTTCAKISIPIHLRAGIQAVAGA